jgi:hypothetical protein
VHFKAGKEIMTVRSGEVNLRALKNARKRRRQKSQHTGHGKALPVRSGAGKPRNLRFLSCMQGRKEPGTSSCCKGPSAFLKAVSNFFW